MPVEIVHTRKRRQRTMSKFTIDKSRFIAITILVGAPIYIDAILGHAIPEHVSHSEVDVGLLRPPTSFSKFSFSLLVEQKK